MTTQGGYSESNQEFIDFMVTQKYKVGDVVTTESGRNSGKISTVQIRVFKDHRRGFEYELNNNGYFWQENSLKPLSTNDVIDGYGDILHALKILATTDNEAIDKSYVEEMLNNLQEGINNELNGVKNSIK